MVSMDAGAVSSSREEKVVLVLRFPRFDRLAASATDADKVRLGRPVGDTKGDEARLTDALCVVGSILAGRAIFLEQRQAEDRERERHKAGIAI